MISVSQKIMKRMRSKGRGKWVWTPSDFIDLGTRAAIDQALSRLARSNELRRIGRGFYDLPRFSRLLQCQMPPDLDLVVAAIARRDGVRILPGGMLAANLLHLTNGVPAKAIYVTDGPTRNLMIDNQTIYLQHAAPRVMAWAGRPSAMVAQALLWFGPRLASHPRVARSLRHTLPTSVRDDLIRHSAHLPGWAVPIVKSLAEPSVPAR